MTLILCRFAPLIWIVFTLWRDLGRIKTVFIVLATGGVIGIMIVSLVLLVRIVKGDFFNSSERNKYQQKQIRLHQQMEERLMTNNNEEDLHENNTKEERPKSL